MPLYRYANNNAILNSLLSWLVFQDTFCYWNENASEDIDTSDNCCRQVLLSRHIGVRGRIRRPARILRLQFALYLRFYHSSIIVQYLILARLSSGEA